MRRTLQIAALACAALLSGCWLSDEPLITQANSSEPMAAGMYTYRNDDGDTPLYLIKFPGGGYVYQLGDETLPVLAHEIADGWYVLEAGPEGDLIYGVGHLTPTRFEIYSPECDAEAFTFSGVELIGGDCEFKSMEALINAGHHVMRRAEAGEDMGLMGWVMLEPLEPAVSDAGAPAFAQAACGGCHGVEPGFESPNAMAPSFVNITNRDGMNADTLLHWLRDAHNYPEEMDFDLNEDQARELSAYIASLREEE